MRATERAMVVVDMPFGSYEESAELAFRNASRILSETGYRPGEPTAAEIALGFDDRSDFEWLEIMNIGTADLDLSGVAFTTGIEFRFDLGTVRFLAPGERVVVVSNRAAFVARYAGILSAIRIAGEFSNDLSNDGETLALTASGGGTIRSFTYNDAPPWPQAADGDGMTLVLINPPGNPDHNDPLSWRSSIDPGGAPGGSDASQFVGDPHGDDDQNGIENLLQYALSGPSGSAVLPTAAVAPLEVAGIINDYLTFSFTRNQAADDLRFDVEVSPDLVTWAREADGAVVLVSRTENGDGTETLLYRVADPLPGPLRLFARLAVTETTP
jgi:hypothetical protein